MSISIEVFEFPKSGDLPVRAQGSRWVTHKRKALQRDGVPYINHGCTVPPPIEDKATLALSTRSSIPSGLQSFTKALHQAITICFRWLKYSKIPGRMYSSLLLRHLLSSKARLLAHSLPWPYRSNHPLKSCRNCTVIKACDGTAVVDFQLYSAQKNKQTLLSCKPHPDLLHAAARAGATPGI